MVIAVWTFSLCRQLFIPGSGSQNNCQRAVETVCLERHGQALKTTLIAGGFCGVRHNRQSMFNFMSVHSNVMLVCHNNQSMFNFMCVHSEIIIIVFHNNQPMFNFMCVRSEIIIISLPQQSVSV